MTVAISSVPGRVFDIFLVVFPGSLRAFPSCTLGSIGAIVGGSQQCGLLFRCFSDAFCLAALFRLFNVGLVEVSSAAFRFSVSFRFVLFRFSPALRSAMISAWIGSRAMHIVSHSRPGLVDGGNSSLNRIQGTSTARPLFHSEF